jgi:hypothetical protein
VQFDCSSTGGSKALALISAICCFPASRDAVNRAGVSAQREK